MSPRTDVTALHRTPHVFIRPRELDRLVGAIGEIARAS